MNFPPQYLLKLSFVFWNSYFFLRITSLIHSKIIFVGGGRGAARGSVEKRLGSYVKWHLRLGQVNLCLFKCLWNDLQNITRASKVAIKLHFLKNVFCQYLQHLHFFK
jgi:hypothetical protein